MFSRDSLPNQIKKNECGIVNLDSKIGSGTHWVAYRNGKSHAEYFDSFGLEMPFEVAQYLDISGKQIYYMEESVLLGTKPLVDSIRHSIRDPSGVFSV